MGNKIFLVLGGSRSGKSEFAEELMYHSTGKRKGYVATSRILDDEMKYRVILHQKRRPEDWKTFEILGEVSGKIGFVLMEADTVLFDCITMYVNNILMEHLANKDNVSYELGMGIVPANAMSRVYRDLVGLANQYVAQKADKVYLSIAGITVELKSRGVEPW